MGKKIFWRPITPLEWVILGIGLMLFSLLVEKSFDILILLGFIIVALFERHFRKKKRTIPSNLMSIGSTIIVVFILIFVINFFILVMQSDVPDLNIPKESRLFIQPVLFKLKEGDLVIYKTPGDPKSYLAVVKGIENGKYNLFVASKKQLISSSRQEIKGKIFFVSRPPTR